MNYFERAKELENETIAHRRHIHQLAELGLKTVETANYIEKTLKEYGIEPKRIGKNGVTALIGKEGKKVILLRADMDALPMEEDTGLDFSATNGNCHACGHDFHAAMLLTAAKMLKENEANLNGCVKLLFQPGEETFEGAKEMVENGILENPKVDAGIAIHTACFVPTGALIYGKGAIAASVDFVRITVTGKAAHGASAYNGVDPINALVHIYQALEAMITREVSSIECASLTFGQIAAGNAANAIPDDAFMFGSLRTYNETVRSYVKERIVALAEGIAQSFKATAKVEFSSSCDSLSVNDEVSEIVMEGVREILPQNVQKLDMRINGSEDYAIIASKVPSIFIGLGTGSAAEGYNCPSHNPKVMFNEAAIPFGVAAYAQGATHWLEKAAQ